MISPPRAEETLPVRPRGQGFVIMRFRPADGSFRTAVSPEPRRSVFPDVGGDPPNPLLGVMKVSIGGTAVS